MGQNTAGMKKAILQTRLLGQEADLLCKSDFLGKATILEARHVADSTHEPPPGYRMRWSGLGVLVFIAEEDETLDCF
ncbi:hypothetical protein LCGC14_1991070 [marine sediment metagenome]|uniref:Uncharacterized protein n=1 Tax=marine sediment metagenome TaxID=412755 RepID=A0A0F9HJF3_9ZZZZ